MEPNDQIGQKNDLLGQFEPSASYLQFIFAFIIIRMTNNKRWSLQEDELLLELHNEIECFQRWKYISRKMKEKGINKTQIECRERFINKLDPSLNHQKFDTNEIKTIFTLYSEYGPIWSSYQSLIPGRNQNMIKNVFYSTLRALVRLFVFCHSKNYFSSDRIAHFKLSSRNLVQIYDGKKGTFSLTKEFKKFKNMIRSSIRFLKYNVDFERAQDLKSQLDQKMLEGFMQALQKAKFIKIKVDENLNQHKKIQEKEQSQKIEPQKPLQKQEEIKQVTIEERSSSNNYTNQYMPTLVSYPNYGYGYPQPIFPVYFYQFGMH